MTHRTQGWALVPERLFQEIKRFCVSNVLMNLDKFYIEFQYKFRHSNYESSIFVRVPLLLATYVKFSKVVASSYKILVGYFDEFKSCLTRFRIRLLSVVFLILFDFYEPLIEILLWDTKFLCSGDNSVGSPGGHFVLRKSVWILLQDQSF